MTEEEFKKYYSDLLILQYRNKEKAVATIEALVVTIHLSTLSISVQNAFSIESAEGEQLDVIGNYVGASRYGYSFDGPIELDDDDFRLMIKMSIVRNTSGSSLHDIQSLLNLFFPGSILVFDYQNMRLSYFFDSSIGSDKLAEMFIKQGTLPKPMGVQLASLIYDANIDNFFGFSTYSIEAENASGYNSYDDYSMDAPWLSYNNVIG